MKAFVYQKDGKKGGEIDLPERLFGLPWNADLIYQVVTSMQSNKRQGTAHAKDRGEVRGGGKKPWQQKGTGRSRHGSIRSPIWIGGGVSHGPTKDKNYDRKINKKVSRKALFTVLSQKLRDGEIVFLDSFNAQGAKTREAAGTLSNIAKATDKEKMTYKKGNRTLIALPKKDEKLLRAFANIKSANVVETRNLNPLLLLSYQYVIFTDPKENMEVLNARA